MKKHLLFTFSSFLFLLLAFNMQAQKVAQASTLEAARTDKNPTYKQFNDQCILDQVEYQEDRTIFHFRYKASTYASIWLYAPDGEHPWYLKDKINDKEFNLIGIYNVRRNNILTHKEITAPYVYMNADSKKETTYFECEVHFERLPETVSEVDLIEGKGMEEAWNHFHCFDIQVNPLKEKKEELVIAPIEIIGIPTLVMETPIQACRCLQATEPIITVITTEVITEETETPVKKTTNTLAEIVKSANWSVFPTPASTVLNVKQTEAQEAQLTLVNINGQVIWTGRMLGTTKTINVSELSTGAYFLQHTAAGTTSSQKVLIK
jgi:hypothetical protein